MAGAFIVIDGDAVRRRAHVAAFAADHHDAEMGLAQAAGRSQPPARVLRRWFVAEGGGAPRRLFFLGGTLEAGAGLAVGIARFLLAAFTNPAEKFIAVETVITAIDHARRRAALEAKHDGGVAFGGPRAVEHAEGGLDAVQLIAAQQTDAVDLVGQLVKDDAAALGCV